MHRRDDPNETCLSSIVTVVFREPQEEDRKKMARIIVYHYSPAARVPKLNAEQCADVRRRFEAVVKDYPGVVFHGVFIGPTGQGFCDWEAPSVDVVKEIVTKVDGHPPVDDVGEIKQIV